MGPNAGLLQWSAVAACLVIAGCVTAAKGRWGWLLAGMLTGGLLWAYSAFLAAAPDSLWARRATLRSRR